MRATDGTSLNRTVSAALYGRKTASPLPDRAFHKIDSPLACPGAPAESLPVLREAPVSHPPKASFRWVRNSLRYRMQRGISAQTVLTLRLSAHRCPRLKEGAESLPHAPPRKRFRRGYCDFILWNALLSPGQGKIIPYSKENNSFTATRPMGKCVAHGSARCVSCNAPRPTLH